MTSTILSTRNEAWGFFGTMQTGGRDPRQSWQIAFPLIVDATGCSPEGVRGFLDSRHGRHFADEVANQLATGLALGPAIEAAIARYQGWRIDRRTQREEGIPAGLPYLTGWVAHFAILDEMEVEARD